MSRFAASLIKKAVELEKQGKVGGDSKLTIYLNNLPELRWEAPV